MRKAVVLCGLFSCLLVSAQYKYEPLEAKSTYFNIETNDTTYVQKSNFAYDYQKKRIIETSVQHHKGDAINGETRIKNIREYTFDGVFRSGVESEWDSLTGDWIVRQKSFNDPENHRSGHISVHENQEEGGVTLTEKRTKRKTVITTHHLYDGKWKKVYVSTIYADKKGREVKYIAQNYDAETQKMHYTERKETHYINPKTHQETYSSWDKTAKKWINQVRYVHTTSENEKIIEDYKWENNKWQIQGKKTHFTDKKEGVQLDSVFIWNQASQKFIPEQALREKLDDDDRVIYSEMHQWNPETQDWHYLSEEYIYYEGKNIITKKIHNYGEEGYQLFNYQYDSEGDLLQFDVSQVSYDLEIFPLERVVYTYHDFLKSEVFQADIFREWDFVESKKTPASVRCFRFVDNKEVKSCELTFSYKKIE